MVASKTVKMMSMYQKKPKSPKSKAYKVELLNVKAKVSQHHLKGVYIYVIRLHSINISLLNIGHRYYINTSFIKYCF